MEMDHMRTTPETMTNIIFTFIQSVAYRKSSFGLKKIFVCRVGWVGSTQLVCRGGRVGEIFITCSYMSVNVSCKLLNHVVICKIPLQIKL